MFYKDIIISNFVSDIIAILTLILCFKIDFSDITEKHLIKKTLHTVNSTCIMYPYPWVIGRLLLYQLFCMCKVYLEYLTHMFLGAYTFVRITIIKPGLFLKKKRKWMTSNFQKWVILNICLYVSHITVFQMTNI